MNGSATFNSAKNWFLVGLLFSVICPIACNQSKTPGALVRPVLSTIASPAVGPDDGYSGSVEPRYETDASFRLLGKIRTRDVDVGDSVETGDLIATLDPELQELAVQAARASLANATAQLENAEAKLKRQEKLLAQNAASQTEYDTAKNAYEAAVADVTQAQTNLSKAEEDLTYTRLKSELDGVVMGLYAERDETVTAGQTVATIANPEIREAVVDIGEDMIRMIQPGTRFRIELQKSDDVETVGEVREIAPQADAKTRTRRVRISLTDHPEGFRLGSTIIARPIAMPQADIRVPITSILDRDGESFVWIVDEPSGTVRPSGVVRLRPVTVSRRDLNTADLSDGVKAGERVVTAGVHSLTAGQPVLLDLELPMGSGVLTNPDVTSQAKENE